MLQKLRADSNWSINRGKKEKKDIKDNLSQKHGGKVIEIITLYNALWRIGPKEKKANLVLLWNFSLFIDNVMLDKKN